MRGNVFEIQHFSVHDGPGIRTTVFLKSCQLKCLWCHNPESISIRASELAFVQTKCVGCGMCFRVCPQGCHYMKDGQHRIDRQNCTFCGKCVRMCAGNALSISGQEMGAQEVIADVLRDKTYYEESGGGMTLSGGEPMLQWEFVKALAALSRTYGIHNCIETNGYYPFERAEAVAPNIDLFLMDWKESDEALHKKYTGVGNKPIFENIKKLGERGNSILLRCPIIPGYNDRDDHFEQIARMTAELKGVVGAEILPYHNLGVNKIEKFGLEGEIKYIVAEPPTKEVEREWIEKCRRFGGNIINEEEE